MAMQGGHMRQPRDPRWRKGTRAMRQRTWARTGNPGQPYAPPTHPERIPHTEVGEHRCGECFGPRSMHRKGPFCTRCERELFGNETWGYQSFVRSERARMRYVLRRWAEAGYVPPDHSKAPQEER
jgi:hypothetical protein